MIRAKKYKPRKLPKMDPFRKRMPDYTDIAYREAVSKLKFLLAESYTPVKYTPPVKDVSKVFECEPQEEVRGSQHQYCLDRTCQVLEAKRLEPPKRPETTSGPPPPELIAFIDRQEDYIDQLEKESQFCREELSNMMAKMKEVIAENDQLHQQRKEALLKSVFDTEEEDEETENDEKGSGGRKTGLNGLKSQGGKRISSNLMFESRISELEAQLTQARMELRKAVDDGRAPTLAPCLPPTLPLDQIHRERDELLDTVASLQTLVTQLREKEASATQKVKRSLDVVDQAQFDKSQLEMEVRRLKAELERLGEKQREALQESSRRVTEAERRYSTQVERLNADLAAQWDTANRLNLELDRARRTEVELRRELAQRNSTIEELKKELAAKTSSLQAEALSAGAERSSLEAELGAASLAAERAEAARRAESARLGAEVAALRSRLERAEADVLSARKENIRLADTIASLEKELSLTKLGQNMKRESGGGAGSGRRDEELASMIRDIDAKHVESVAELESMIQSQTRLMEKLKDECRGLTERLEESATRHKEEIAGLQNNIEYLNSKLEAPVNYDNQDWRDDGMAYQDSGVYQEPQSHHQEPQPHHQQPQPHLQDPQPHHQQPQPQHHQQPQPQPLHQQPQPHHQQPQPQPQPQVQTRPRQEPALHKAPSNNYIQQ